MIALLQAAGAVPTSPKELILNALYRQPRTTAQLAQILGLSAPAVHRHVAELLDSASHVPAWAVAHADNGFLSTEELVETIRDLRRVGTIYTKDFTELNGARAVIITA